MKRLGYKGLAIGAIVTSVLVGVAAFSATDPSGPTTLQSSAVVSASSTGTLGNTAVVPPTVAGPSNRVNAGDTVAWTDTFQNTGTKVASGSVTQTFNKQTPYKPGSVSVPDGWEATFSTDNGATFKDVEPTAIEVSNGVKVTDVRVSAPFVPAEGRSGVATAINAPTVSSISTSISGGGDSFELLFYKQNIYSALHHTTLKLLCFNKNDGSSCGSFGPSRTLFSSDVADAWVDQSNGKAYFPAIDRANGGNKVVLSCLDFDTQSDCGITELDGDGVSLSAALVSQPWMYNGEVMFVYPRKATKELMVGCITAATMAPCAGQPFSAGLDYPVGTTTNFTSRKNNVYWSADGTTPYRDGGLVSYTAVADGTSILSLECFDSANRTPCAGQVAASWDGGQDPVLRSDASGEMSGFCARPNMTGAVVCFDLAGQPQSVPASFEAWVPKTRVSWNNVLGGYGLVSAGRSYIPLSQTNPESVPCYDWKTGAACVGFPFISSVSRKAYSLRRDPFAPTCMWKMSDDGFLESFHANGGPPGCTSGTVSAKPLYCAAKAPPRVTGWDAVRLNDLSASGFSGFALTLKDSTGAIIPGWSGRKYGASTTVVDISSLSFAGTQKALTAEIAFSGLKASAFTSATPTMEISWKGDPLEVCTQTVVPPYCPDPYVPIVANAVGVTSTAETGGTASVSLIRAFDYITSATCALPNLSILTKINGQRSTDPNAPVDIPVVPSLVLEVTYTVTNNGTTDLLNPGLLDDAGTAGTPSVPAVNDDPIIDPIILKPAGAGNILRSRQTWTFKGRARPLQDLNQLHPTLTGTPIDGNGVPVGTLPVTEDRVSYFLSHPDLKLFVGIYEGPYDGGAGCLVQGKATAEFYAPPAALLTYCYVLTNIGNVDLGNITIDDNGFSKTNLKTQGGATLAAPLPAGKSITLYFETTNTGDRKTEVAATGTHNGRKVTATARANLGPRQLPAT
jgi:hypothetical protein